jgi:hypothetical protein
LKDGKGRDYYFNTVTKESKWKTPDVIAKEQEAHDDDLEPPKAMIEI